MSLLFLILIIVFCALLGVVILIQNPKGGGLAGTIGGFNNQFMGVKQTNDFLEKGTWIFSGVIGVLCLFSTFFMGGDGGNKFIREINTGGQQTTTPITPQPVIPEADEAPAQQPEP